MIKIQVEITNDDQRAMKTDSKPRAIVNKPMKYSVNYALSALQAVLFVLIFSSAVGAEPIAPELIPPDVTLSPKSVGKTKINQSVRNKSAPGMKSKGSKPVPSRATYGSNPNYPSNGITSGKGIQPPPKGSSLFTGIPNTGKTNPAAAGAGNQAQSQDPYCVVDTNKGKITIRLFQKFAPNTVKAFIKMINEGFYNGLTWHRYVPGFVIQGGCPQGNGTGFYIDPQTNQPRTLLLETNSNLRHNAAGVVAMAHTAKNPHSSSCQFYITLAKKSNLDFKYTIFGGVVDGLDVVFKLRKGDKINSINMVR